MELAAGVIPFIYEAVHNVSEVTHDPKRWETLKREVMNEDPAKCFFLGGKGTGGDDGRQFFPPVLPRHKQTIDSGL